MQIIKSFTVLSLLFLLFSNAKAQSYSLGADATIVIGENKEFYNNTYGVSVQYDIPITDNIAAILRSGFLYIPFEEFEGIFVYQVPALVGGKYHFHEKFYGMAATGITYFNAVTVLGTGSTTRFTFTLGAGAKLGRFDITPRVDIVSQGWSQLGLRIAYYFRE